MTSSNAIAPPLSLETTLFGAAIDAAAAVPTPEIIVTMLDSGKGISDLIFSPGRPPQVEQHGELTPVAVAGLSALGAADTARVARDLIGGSETALRTLHDQGACDLAYSLPQRSRFRVNIFRQRGSFAIVMRVIASKIPTLADLNLPEALKDTAALKNGIVLVTGPTGSGKTVSLYTGLNILNTPDRNISTAEDPAEINLFGINQVNVNAKVGLTFSAALKAFLRQDPDIIMVGEIRDLETAEIAIKAAQTGHMVLSTLHTNDAPKTLTRMVDMGVAPFAIASSVNLIIAQRLGRRLCPKCKAPHDVPKAQLLKVGFKESDLGEDFQVYKPVGCDQCTLGYKGRVGIYQVMPVSEVTGRIIMEGGNSIAVAEQAAKEGIPDLPRSGLMKVQQGLMGLDELHRVISSH